MYHITLEMNMSKRKKGINETLLLRLVYLPPGLLLLDSWCLRGWVLGGGHRGWVDGLRAGSGAAGELGRSK